MAPSSGNISFTYDATEVEISSPQFGYTTTIEYPWDYLKMSDGTYQAHDDGAQYDKRSCVCEFILSGTEMDNLQVLVNATARGQNLVMTLPSDSGFFPFGPDKGDAGTFTVAVFFDTTGKISMSPYRKWIVRLRIVNVGAYPAYSLPAQVTDGSFIFGSVSECRMPQNLFEPQIEYAVSIDFTENNTAHYFDRGEEADVTLTQFTLQMNESKAAAIFDFITNTARTAEFNIETADYFYAFGMGYGSGISHAVQLLSKTFQIRHVRHNEFETSFKLQRVG